MDIRFINRKNEIINASRLSIKIIGDCLIGYNEENDAITIEQFKDCEEAEKALKYVGGRIMEMNIYGNNIMIDLRREEYK